MAVYWLLVAANRNHFLKGTLVEYKASNLPLHRRITVAYEGLRIGVRVFGFRFLGVSLWVWVRYVITAEVPSLD